MGVCACVCAVTRVVFKQGDQELYLSDCKNKVQDKREWFKHVRNCSDKGQCVGASYIELD